MIDNLHTVTYDEWHSGTINLTNEEFYPVLGDVIGYYADKDKNIILERQVIGYCGKDTNTRLGLWFSEVMEPV